MLKWIGTLDICFDFPVMRSVSSEISLLTEAGWVQDSNRNINIQGSIWEVGKGKKKRKKT